MVGQKDREGTDGWMVAFKNGCTVEMASLEYIFLSPLSLFSIMNRDYIRLFQTLPCLVVVVKKNYSRARL